MSVENFRRWTFVCFRIFHVSKRFTPTREIWSFSAGTTLSLSTENIRGGTLHCFKKTPISINFLHRRRKSHFSDGNILSHSTKKLSRWPFSVWEQLRYRKTFSILGVITAFFGVFMSLFGEKGRTGFRLCLRIILISEKNFWIRGEGITFFLRKL